ncbi:hypothetical protein FOZ63_026105 [Perkinsus olseni]|uniref:Uncharacterized protein n=1 Tax=Perkinsus olseni TaxID=32597 RepID=A0A7J6Q4G7_PEROL|nr:hypothetical protein FOZ63_026105 [Perkinsus olseni]
MLITSLSPFAEVAAQAAQNDVAITGCEPSDFHTDTQFTELSIGTHVEGSACCNAEVNDSQTTVDGCCWRCIDSRGVYLVDPYIHVWKGYDDPDNNLNDRDHQLRFEQLRNDLHYSPSIPDWKYAFMRDFSFSLAPWWQTKDLPRPTFM